MGNYFKDVGWILLGVAFGAIALIAYFFGLMNMVDSSWGSCIGAFVIGIIFTVMSIVALRHKSP